MKKESLLLTMFLFIAPWVTGQPVRQKVLEKARIDLIKRSLEFLATDEKTFKAVKQPFCEPCESKNDLFRFIEVNRLKGAQERVKQWLSLPDSTFSQNDLASLRTRILQDLTSGPSDRVARKTLPSFKAYALDMETIVSGATTQAMEAENSVPADPEIPPGQPTGNPSPSLAVTAVAGGLPVVPSEYFYALLAVALAAIIFLVVRLNKGGQREKESKHDARKSEKELKFLTLKLEDQEAKSRTLTQELSALEDQLKTYEAQLEAERRKNLERDMHVQSEYIPQSVSPQKQNTPVVRYAKYADLGDGFSASELSSEADSETIFEITLVTERTGTFRITDNEHAQKYALANSSYFLGSTSQYDALPSSPNSTIFTDRPGELTLQGNKWRVTNPAKIRFS